MRKSPNYTSDTTKTSFNKNVDIDKIKTTNVNILLNRVRLDEKRILKFPISKDSQFKKINKLIKQRRDLLL